MAAFSSMTTPLVSVLLPVYNAQDYLKQSIDSILGQTFTDFELIIINDGSRDNSKVILDSISDPRIRLYHQENKGLANDGYLETISYFQPPIDKIAKFKLKFRYHNGMLVDLHNCNISLSLEINQIRNEMNNYEVRSPFKI
jgi:glycosyltransferase involved in cell wall biosynthesis